MDHNSRKRTYSLSFDDFDDDNWRLILDDFVKNGGDINSSLVESGPKAGYTELHFACMDKAQSFKISRLIVDYKADVNSVGKDGAQPIHLACIFGNVTTAVILLESGANVEAEISKELYEKYAEDKKWTDDFGGKMTLLVWTIINNYGYLMECLLRRGSNFAIKDINNKTLLMYAGETNNSFIVFQITLYLLKHPKLINVRDSRGLHAVHYIISNEIFGEYRYDQSIFVEDLGFIVDQLIRAGADMNATVNGDPDTLLLNKAAYRLCCSLVDKLLDLKVPLSKKAKPLCYLTLPVVDTTKCLNPNSINDYNAIKSVTIIKKKCIESILKNFVIRRSFGWFVPEEELKLMDQLVATDSKIREFVSDCEENIINAFFKDKVIYYDDKYISIREILEKIFDDKSLKLLVQDDSFVDAYYEFSCKWLQGNEEIKSLVQQINFQILQAYRRRKLLQEIAKIENLMKAIPLSYEVILDIIDFIDNDSLDKFINAFNNESCNNDGSYSAFYRVNDVYDDPIFSKFSYFDPWLD